MTPAELCDAARDLRPLCVRWAASVVPDHAEDVAQEALVALTRRRDDVPRDKAGAWLREAVRRIALDTRSKQRDVPGDVSQAPCRAPSPEDTLASAEVSQVMRAALARMPESRRRVVVEVVGEETSIAAVAREDGIAESTVRTRLAVDVADLRDELQRQRVAEKRRGGSTSWCVVLGLTDVRAALKRIALLGTTAAVIVAGGASLHSPALGPTAIEAPARVVMVDTVRPVVATMAERSVERPAPASPEHRRARHDAAARFAAERFGR